MPRITINGRSLDAPAGVTILDASRGAGIEIPTLCWYPKLPVVGNCRLCVVSVEGQGKLLPACATKVADGMQVTTESPAAIEARRGVLQFLLAERVSIRDLGAIIEGIAEGVTVDLDEFRLS